MTWTLFRLHSNSNVISGNENAHPNQTAFDSPISRCHSRSSSLSLSNDFFLEFICSVCLFSIFTSKTIGIDQIALVFPASLRFLHRFSLLLLLLMMVLIVSIWTGSHNCKRMNRKKISRIHRWRRWRRCYDRIFIVTSTQKQKFVFSLLCCGGCLCLDWNPMTIFNSFHLCVVFRAFRWKWMDVCIINLSIH